MDYFTKDAEMSSAREILFLCRGRLSTEIPREKSKSQLDAQRLADLELVIAQLRDEIDAVTAGDRAMTTRVFRAVVTANGMGLTTPFNDLLKRAKPGPQSEVVTGACCLIFDQPACVIWRELPRKRRWLSHRLRSLHGNARDVFRGTPKPPSAGGFR